MPIFYFLRKSFINPLITFGGFMQYTLILIYTSLILIHIIGISPAISSGLPIQQNISPQAGKTAA